MHSTSLVNMDIDAERRAPATSAGCALSLTGWQWNVREADERSVTTMMQRHGLPEAIARILSIREVAVDEVEHFLNPSLKAWLPDPSHLLDMDKAAARVASAVTKNERIAIFGDYDVDGATSSALLMRYLRALGSEPIAYIPDRMKEGYGPNAPALLALKEQGISLVITVDCGTLAFEPLAAAHKAGLDVIVVDHHIGEARLPACTAVINPNRLDETSPHRHLAAVGVAFLLCVAVNRELRKMGYFNPLPLREGVGGGVAPHTQISSSGLPPSLTLPLKGGGNIMEPDLKQWLDIVALGTVCDVVPLKGINRAFVTQGLKIMAARGNPGLRTVLDLAAVDAKPGTYHAGFVVGPRINAGGRVGKSDLGVRLLTTEDDAEALMLAKELERHNAERKTIEAIVLEEALAQAEKADSDAPMLVLAGKGWHPGVLGIVAGRIKDKFHKPVAIIGVEQNIGKASARSIEGFDIGAAVIAARDSGLLMAGGGHAMAAGFTVEEAKIAALVEFLSARAATKHIPHTKQLWIDANVAIGGATAELVETLERIGPFGQGNPHLRLAIHNVINLRPEWTKGEGHARTLLICPQSNARLFAIAFRVKNTKLGEALFATRGKKIAVAGQLRLQEWQGKKNVSLQIEDICG